MHAIRKLKATDEPGVTRAVCRCGWSARNEDVEELDRVVAAHLKGTVEPPAKVEGFVSGLADWPWK